MAIGEFELIARYFTRPVRRAAIGVGDDCALLGLSPGHRLLVSSDMLVEGRHFVSTVQPRRLGHKSLAVNLSDLAACGGSPLAFTLAIAMPRIDEVFLEGFADGLLALAQRHDIELVGGDTTAGPLAICITVLGEVPDGDMLRRDRAQPGDDIWISGTPGDARLALEAFRGSVVLPGDVLERVRMAIEQPLPRVALGRELRGIATSAIDVSDGLLGDLHHILSGSRVGASLDVDAVPLSDALAAMPARLRREFSLAGGDDYELLFTAAPARRDAVAAAAQRAATPVTRIGHIDAEPGLRLHDSRGAQVAGRYASFDHFRAP